MSHPIVHIELSAEDRKELSSFYSTNFGWEMQHFDDMNYTTFTWGVEGQGGGFNPVSEDNPAGTIVPYIQVDDIHASLEQIEGSGGRTLVAPMEVPGVGLIAHFSDPSGNRMAILQPAEEAM